MSLLQEPLERSTTTATTTTTTTTTTTIIQEKQREEKKQRNRQTVNNPMVNYSPVAQIYGPHHAAISCTT